MKPPRTRKRLGSGQHPRKHLIRALFRSVSVVGLVVAYSLFGPGENQEQSLRSVDGGDNDGWIRRRLEEVDDEKQSLWLLIPYVVGVLYMFLALAVSVDEIFVPALEEISGPDHLNLSMDVAGATLMAAGGSAPELFTALIGTFKESSIGFGTIVGSAVFNVLFVIGTVSLLSNEVLQLTWWPLFRDSTCYIIGLVVLGALVQFSSPGEIELWEAFVLLALYVGYVLLMAVNEKLYAYLTGNKKQDAPPGPDAESNGGQNGDAQAHDEQPPLEITSSSLRRWPNTFRAGVLTLISDPNSRSSTAGTNLVANLRGDADDAFRHVDKDGNGVIEKEELRLAMNGLGMAVTGAGVETNTKKKDFDELFAEIDKDGNGKIGRVEFKDWYAKSEERMLNSAEVAFKKLDTDKSGTIDREEVSALILNVAGIATDEQVTEALDAMNKSGDETKITLEEFYEWYKTSLFFENEKQWAEEQSEGIFASVRPPKGQGLIAYTCWLMLLPIVFTLAFTVPDVRRPGMGKWCYLSFVLAIVWIAGYSFGMVEWATEIGEMLGIPDQIMGLTFIAAGTSVPDLLSSVIVAKRGEGDMAVSSSIGSNIFDILVGLPLPWIIYSLYNSKSVTIGSENVEISIGILIGMLALIIITIHLNGWRLTKYAGIMMFILYAIFVAQEILREFVW